MLPVTSAGIRLFLHVLAATVWVGGQVVLAGLVPALRPSGREAVAAAARRFQLLAWPAWGVLLLTGLWNLEAAEFSRRSDAWQITVMAKIGAFLVAGAASALHTVAGAGVRLATSESEARRRRALAGALAAVSLLASLAALCWGVLLRA